MHTQMHTNNINDGNGSLFPVAVSELFGDIFSKNHILNF